MSSNDFDFIKNTIKHFVEDNKFTILNSREEFITDNILKFFNSKNNTNFKKTLEKNTNKPKIEMSEIIKGDFIIFEDYDLFQYDNIPIESQIDNLSENTNSSVEINSGL